MSTFSGTTTTGIVLGTAASVGTYTNPLTITSTGSVSNTSGAHGDDAVYGPTGTAWTVDNFGHVSGAAAYGANGIHLLAGGNITNGGLISGAANGVLIAGGGGTVQSYGTIAATNAGGVAVDFLQGGYVSDSGLMEGGADGILIAGAAGTLDISGTLVATGTTGNGAYLKLGGSLTNGNTGTISGYDGVRIGGGTGTLTNSGSIVSTGTGFGAQGVDFLGGGTLTNYGTILGANLHASGINAGFNSDVIINGATGDRSALIEGQLNGVDQFSSSGTVVNFATVASTGGDGVYLQAGGSVSNSGTAALISGLNNGVRIAGAAGTVENEGTIAATAAGTTPNGIYLAAGGTVINSGTVKGSGHSVFIIGGAGTVINSGSMSTTVSLRAGGTVSNASAGLISSVLFGIYIGGVAGTLANLGTITASGTAGIAVDFGKGGTVTNGSTADTSALIAAGGIGVEITGGAGTVTNFGTLLHSGAGPGGAGAYFAAGGLLTNYGLIAGAGTTGAGFGPSTAAVILHGVTESGTVLNFGTIDPTTTNGNGVNLDAGGKLVNGSPTIRTALVTGAGAAVFVGGTSGTATSGAVGFLYNYGTIAGTGTGGLGIDMISGGSVSNNPNGLVKGTADGVLISGAAGTVRNSGTILALGSNVNASGSIVSGNAVDLVAGGIATNGTAGLIEGYHIGILSGTVTTTVVNFGSIVALQTVANGFNGVGVQLDGGGSVNNSGLISGQFGVSFNGTAGPGTVVNSGTILGGTTGTAAGAVNLSDGGLVVNYGLMESDRAVRLIGSLTAHGAVVTIATASGTIQNFGTIATPGTNASQGINLLHGGVIVNGASNNTTALISGVASGIYAGGHITTTGTLYYYPGATSKITNYGTIASTSSFSAVFIVSGGEVINHGLISSATGTGITFKGLAGTVINFGTIAKPSTGTTNNAIYVGHGGTVINYGLVSSNAIGITGNYTGVITGRNVALTVVNFATITNPSSNGINLENGGLLINGSAATTSATVYGRLGVYVGGTSGTPTPGALGTIVNYGTIANDRTTSQAVRLVSGGTVLNHRLITSPRTGISFGGSVAGTVDNFGSVVSTAATTATAGTGVYMQAGGIITNESGATIQAVRTAITFNDTAGTTASIGTVANYGTITSSNSVAVSLSFGGTVSNAASGLIAGGGGGVYILGSAGTLSNFGTIKSTSPLSFDGVFLGAGGSVGNSGLISGLDGVDLRVGGTVSNSGTIVGYGSGNVAGIFLGFTYTAGAFQVTNSGSILSSASAVIMRGDGDVSNKAGALIEGGAAGISISGTGTIDNFGTITGTSGTAISLGTATDTVIVEQGSTIVGTLTGFSGNDAIDVPFITFSSGNTATLDSSDVLTISGGGKSTTVQLDSGVSGKSFSVRDDGSGGTEVTLSTAVAATATLFDFIFVYNDGKDYYLGSVADDGTFGYLVGGTQTTSAGTYTIIGTSGTTSEAAGTVAVTFYSHRGVGEASPTPLLTASGKADGTGGLGSEIDSLSGVDQLTHFFSGTEEASFTTTALFGFVYTFADGTSYSGTVADSSGTLPASKTVTDANGNVIGSYRIFADGVSGRASGSVVVDRYTAGGQSFVPVHSSTNSVDGTGGLGSEQGTISVNGVTASFSDIFEPSIGAALSTAAPVAAPSSATVSGEEVDQIFSDILGRAPTASELDTYSAEIDGGTSTATIRAAIAATSEAQHDLSLLYQQVLDRAATGSELSSATDDLANGGSLRTEQLLLAGSSEAESAINQIYQDVLGRAADPDGLAAYVAELGDESSSNLADPGGKSGLEGVRDIVAHSGEAAKALTTLFQDALGRAPGAAELVGMEDQLAVAGTTQTTLQTSLDNTGSAGGYTTLTAPAGSATLTATSGTPTLFVFTNIAFGNDTISGFDGTRDTIELPKTLVPDLATLTGETASVNGGSLITLGATQSIFITATAPTLLNATNFLFV